MNMIKSQIVALGFNMITTCDIVDPVRLRYIVLEDWSKSTVNGRIYTQQIARYSIILKTFTKMKV